MVLLLPFTTDTSVPFFDMLIQSLGRSSRLPGSTPDVPVSLVSKHSAISVAISHPLEKIKQDSDSESHSVTEFNHELGNVTSDSDRLIHGASVMQGKTVINR